MSSVLDQVEQECICAVCLAFYTEPRQLQCAHTFCTMCLAPLIRRDHAGQYIECPICRAQTRLTMMGVLNLPKNIHISNIVEKLKLSRVQLPQVPLEITATNRASSSSFFFPPSTEPFEDEYSPSAPPIDHEPSAPVWETPGPELQVPPTIESTSSLTSNPETGELPEKSDSRLLIQYLPYDIHSSRIPSLFIQWVSSLWLAPAKHFCAPSAPSELHCAHVESNGTQNAVSRAVSGNHARNYKNIIFVAAEEGVPGYNLIAKLKHDDWDISRLISQSVWTSLWDGVKSLISTAPTTENKYTTPPQNVSLLAPILQDTAWQKFGKLILKELELAAIRTSIQSSSVNVTVKSVSVETEVVAASSKLFYLPAYLCTYSFESKLYQLLIDGKGKCEGERPHNTMGKIVSFGSSLWSKFTSQ